MARHQFVRSIYVIVVLIVSSGSLLRAETKHPLTPEACTAMRYLSSGELTDRSVLQLSPDGSRLAYVVQTPDLQANNNADELYVTAVDAVVNAPRIPIARSQTIAAIRWFPDGKSLATLVRRNGKIVLSRFDLLTKVQEEIWETDGNIVDYSMDAAGKTIAVAVNNPDDNASSPSAQHDSARGYRIDLSSTPPSRFPGRRVYILRQADDNHWTIDRRVTFASPLTGKEMSLIVGIASNHINLSPDGRFLLLDSVESFSEVPNSGVWGSSSIVNELRKEGFPFAIVTYLYDLTTGEVSLPLASPLVRSTSWAADSKSFMVVALAPAGSAWEKVDASEGNLNQRITHMFAVDIHNKGVTEVLHRAEAASLASPDSTHVLVRDGESNLTLFQNDNNHWLRAKSYKLPLEGLSPYSSLTSDGRRVVVEYENARTAPEIVAINLATMEATTIANLDPEINDFVLPKEEVVTWTSSMGYTAKGLLLLPPDYDPHHRYPIVIEDGSLLYHGQFICDSGTDHVASWPRAILANDGILYLTRFWPGNKDSESDYYPKDLPGTLGEAAFKQDLVESAIKTLDQLKIIDPERVGLVGFSRGGWYVEYTLAHSQLPFRVASATDFGQYSLGEYWLRYREGQARVSEGLYGGPPYGDSLKNWLKYSISFNVDKVHTPLLMEVMGYGKEDNDRDRTPGNLAVHEEVFVGLSRLRKPVEFYYYPHEDHQAEHPQARIASLYRNIDWYRFWLQDYERPNAEDPDQYRRWEALRNLHNADQKDLGVPATH